MTLGLKDIIRYFLAGLLFFLGITWLRAVWIRRKYPLVRFVLVHHIRVPTKFEAMVKYITKNHNAISFEDFKAGRLKKDKINVVLTLDDGYNSWKEVGIPILERYNLPAIFFVTSGFVSVFGKFDEVESFCKDNLKLKTYSEPLSVDNLLKSAGHPLVTIGGHTYSHPLLDRVDQDIAKQEVFKDKEYLESITKKPLEVFAFPFGRGNYSVALLNILKVVGYHYAVTTHSDFYRPDGNSYKIPRSNHGTVSPLLLSMWIWGAFDLVESLENVTRRFFGKLQ